MRAFGLLLQRTGPSVRDVSKQLQVGSRDSNLNHVRCSFTRQQVAR